MINFLKVLLRLFFAVSFRVKCSGLDNIPEKGGAILCSNHIGEIDMLFIGYKMKRDVHWMAKEELFKIPIVGAFLRKIKAYPVRRGNADTESIKTSLKLLSQGNIIGMFPEGTRTKGKNINSISVKRGAVILSSKAGVPIIPVALRYSLKPFGRVYVVYGKLINDCIGQDFEGKKEDANIAMRKVVDTIYGLLLEK